MKVKEGWFELDLEGRRRGQGRRQKEEEGQDVLAARQLVPHDRAEVHRAAANYFRKKIRHPPVVHRHLLGPQEHPRLVLRRVLFEISLAKI